MGELRCAVTTSRLQRDSRHDRPSLTIMEAMVPQKKSGVGFLGAGPVTKGDWASVMAVSVTMMLPQAIIFGVLNKYFSAGVSADRSPVGSPHW